MHPNDFSICWNLFIKFIGIICLLFNFIYRVATGNPVVFTLSPPECYMEIRNGYGIGGTRVTGPVRVGDPLTLMIYMRSKYDGFDIVVNDCYAHNGANKRIQLIDEYG